MRDARIVDEDRQAAIGFLHFVDDGRAARRIGHVQDQALARHAFGGQVIGNGLRAAFRGGGTDHGGTLLAQFGGDGAADAARGARDQHDLIC